MAHLTLDDLNRIRRHLSDDAFLYESPDAYEAGVEATCEALEALASTPLDRSGAGGGRGAVSVPGLVIELEDLEITAR